MLTLSIRSLLREPEAGFRRVTTSNFGILESGFRDSGQSLTGCRRGPGRVFRAFWGLRVPECHISGKRAAALELSLGTVGIEISVA